MERQYLKVGALASVLFFRMLGVFIILPVAAVMVKSVEGGNGWLAGLALGGYGITQALMQIPIGWLADRWGRKPVLLGALALFASGGFLAAAADDITGIVIGRMIQGAGAVASIAAAWIGDITTDNRRSVAMALFGGAIALAFVVSLLLAPWLTTVTGLSGIFTIAGWLGVLSMLLLLPLPSPPQRLDKQPMAIYDLLRHADLLRCAGGAFVLHYALTSLFFLLPISLVETVPVSGHSVIYAIGFFSSLLVAVPLLARLDRNQVVLMSVSIALTIVGSAILSLATAPIPAVFALFFFFAGFIVLEAALPAIAVKSAPAERRAVAVGIVMTAEFFGIFCGGAITGFIQQTLGSTMAVCVVCLFLAIWLASILWGEQQSRRQ